MRCATIGTALLLAACSSLTAPEEGLELRTSRAVYAPWDTIDVSITNRASEIIYVAHCNQRVSLTLEKNVGNVWTHHRQVNGPLCQAIYPMGDTAIVRGTPLTESLHLDETGQFRLTVYGRRASEDFGTLHVASPPFTVSYPPD